MECTLDINTVVFEHGGHQNCEGHFCVLEAANCIKRGVKTDDHLPGLPESRIMLSINDWRGWTSDKDRTEFLRPYVKKFLAMEPDEERTRRRTYALADYAVRVIAPEALESAASVHPIEHHQINMREHAEKLKALKPIAAATYAAARAAAYAAADAAARASAYAATYAAADAAAYAAARAAARDNYLRHAKNLLDIATGN